MTFNKKGKFIFLFFAILLVIFSCSTPESGTSDDDDENNEDSTPPKIISIDPINGSTNVDLNYWGFTIEFNEDMKTGYSVTNNSSRIENLCDWHSSNPRIFYYIFQEALQPNTTYSFTLNPSDHSLNFKDLAGNSLKSDTTFSFTTGNTTNQPVVFSSSINNGSTNVAVDAGGINITFDQPMFQYGFSFQLNPEVVNVSYYWLNSTTYRIDFNESLYYNTAYTISLNGTGTHQGFRSTNSVRLQENTEITFTTEPAP